MQQTATNVNLGPEVEKDTQQEKARVQNTSASEQSRLRPDEDGGNNEGYEREQGNREDNAPDEETELLRQQASARLTNLPVDKGKYARRQEHSIDIRV